MSSSYRVLLVWSEISCGTILRMVRASISIKLTISKLLPNIRETSQNRAPMHQALYSFLKITLVETLSKFNTHLLLRHSFYIMIILFHFSYFFTFLRAFRFLCISLWRPFFSLCDLICFNYVISSLSAISTEIHCVLDTALSLSVFVVAWVLGV